VLPSPTFPMLAAAIVALAAVITDLRARRIPNWLTFGAVGLALGANVGIGAASNGSAGAANGALTTLVGTALGFSLLLPFYVIRISGLGHAIGAGDVKLLAALGALVGPQALVSIAIYAALAGAAQSIFILASYGRLGVLLQQTLAMRGALSGFKAPYALAIGAGVLMSMLLPPIMRG
jgi:prepilin peptidase CpaA